MESSGRPLATSEETTLAAPPAPPEPPSLLKFIFFNERELRAGWRLLLYLLLMTVVGTIAARLLRFLGALQAVTNPMTAGRVIAQELVLVLAVVVPAPIMGHFERRTLADYGLPLRSAFGRYFWFGAVWGLGALTLLLMILRINGSFLFGSVDLSARALLGYAALWAIAMYLVAIAEEFMLRGYTQFTLTTGMGFWPAAALLSLVFAALHLPNAGETKVGIGSVVAIALFFAFTLYRTGSLWFAIGMHAAWNWGQTFLYGVPNSGMVAKGHLLNPTIQGSDWYSGGSAGPEGSILIFPLIALLFVVFDRTFPKGSRYIQRLSPAVPAQDAALG